MKRIVCIAVGTIAICLMSSAGYTQSGNLKLVFHVPFPFTAERILFSPGEYEVTQPDHFILMLRNEKTQSSAFEHVKPAQSRTEADGRARLVFHRYGNEYFLTEVTDGSIQSTYDFRESNEEKRLADVTPRPELKIVSVLSNGTVQATDDRRK